MSTLSVSEILAWNPDIDLFDFQFKGGWPEIYAENLSPVDYLNDYIRSAIERDIIFANGIQKADEFLRFLRLLANRTGEILSLESLSRDAGVVSNSLREWLSLLTRMGVVGVLPTYSSHLNKRLTKQGKVYFMDCGLAARLQGYTSLESLKSNPRLGSLFETLVYAEIMKAKMNHRLDLTPYLWCTKDQEEIDFFIETPRKIILIEAKMAMQNIQPIKISESVKKVIGGRDWTAVTVTFGSGASVGLLPNNQQIPIGELQSFLRASI
jgi:predicted AAA+ superfamily ATPase